MADLEPIRVVLADDHPVFREGLASLLGSIPGLTVVGTAADGNEAVAVTRSLQPDVVVMDVSMPGLNGIEATRQVTTDTPHVAVLVLTVSEDDATVFAAMRAGARGYLDKAATQSEIVSAITAVADGEVIFGPTIARRVVEYFAAAESPTSGMAGVYPELTVREREVLDLAAGGRSKSQIASSLVLSPKSLRTNVSNIFVKLHVADRADAIVRAGGTGGWR